MGSHVYHEIFLHLNWHTKSDLPLLTGDLEALAHAELKAKCLRIKGAYLHGLGGTDTHVHLALSIEPFVRISDLVQELKGASSFEVNKRMNRKGAGVAARLWRRKFRKEKSRLGARLCAPAARASREWANRCPTRSVRFA